ncbi:T9SS type A sorting domain-containing protein [Parabacteroides sp. TM07-1AC]|jgi:hypothetical protein|uniref:T9SS type A sorting domain-containing protein n=1 Tax=Parabacteroides sp. TM07-1AC TaxID=2292363 RepID=UPI0013144474|nr:T9SS type A sorting domain-containing protein [Parabacteroides sp. TM07-1AC]
MKKIFTLAVAFMAVACGVQAQVDASVSASMKIDKPIESFDYVAPIQTKADAATFVGGTGTEADPYQIATKEDLQKLAELTSKAENESLENLKGVFFKQTADIVFEEGDKMPVIGAGAYFCGTYDGDGYMIKNFTITGKKQDSKSQVRALFIYCKGATLKNIHMVGTKVEYDLEGADYSVLIGGLAFQVVEGKMINCTTEGTYTVRAKGEVSSSAIGGLAVSLTNSTVENCRTYGTYLNEVAVNGGEQCYVQIGGIAAEMYNSNIIDCFTGSTMEDKATGNVADLILRTAGIAAFAQSCQVEHVASVGESFTSIADNKQEGGKTTIYTAGLVAVANYKSMLSNSWSAVTTLKSEEATGSIEPAYTAFLFGDSKSENTFYANSAEVIKEEEFINEINGKFPASAKPWLFRENDYPSLLPLYTVTLPTLTGATTTPGEGVAQIEEGERFRFSLVLEEEYNQSKPVVTVGDKTLEPDANMNYVTEPVTADMVVKIDGIVKNTETANEEINASVQKVYVADGILYIQPEATAQVNVFNMQGQLVKSTLVSSEAQIQLPQGLYIVRLNDQSYKVRISE